MSIAIILIVLAVITFALAAINVSSSINLTALGLAFFAASFLIR